MTFSQTLNARQRPETLQLKNGAGSTLQSLTYGYSAAGDVTWILDGVDGADTVNNLTYDGLHRLKTANGIWGSYSYTYDGLNNLISRTGTNPLNYGYDAATNRLSGVSGAVSRNYGYNPRGGMIGDGTKSFTLNSNDQITSITGIASYGYDGNGKRVKTTKADGSIEYAIYDQSGALVSHALVTAGQNNDYLQLDGRTIAEVLNGSTTYLHADLLGSPRLATNANGGIQWREHYGPYGEKLNGVNDKIGYTGHAYDAESQLTYAQARFYDPAVGRFMSMDPIGFTGNPASFTRYAYGNNNPYRYTDPTGMTGEDGADTTKPENELQTGSHVLRGEGVAGAGGVQYVNSSGGTAFTGDQTMVAAGGGAERGGERGIRGGLFQDPATEDLDVLNGAIDPICGTRLLQPIESESNNSPGAQIFEVAESAAARREIFKGSSFDRFLQSKGRGIQFVNPGSAASAFARAQQYAGVNSSDVIAKQNGTQIFGRGNQTFSLRGDDGSYGFVDTLIKRNQEFKNGNSRSKNNEAVQRGFQSKRRPAEQC